MYERFFFIVNHKIRYIYYYNKLYSRNVFVFHRFDGYPNKLLYPIAPYPLYLPVSVMIKGVYHVYSRKEIGIEMKRKNTGQPKTTNQNTHGKADPKLRIDTKQLSALEPPTCLYQWSSPV